MDPPFLDLHRAAVLFLNGATVAVGVDLLTQGALALDASDKI